MARMLCLTPIGGEHPKKRFECIPGMNRIISRASVSLGHKATESNSLLDSPIISRNHATISFKFDSQHILRAYLVDGFNGRRSTHGTSVKDSDGEEHLDLKVDIPIFDGDIITFGKFVVSGEAIRYRASYTGPEPRISDGFHNLTQSDIMFTPSPPPDPTYVDLLEKANAQMEKARAHLAFVPAALDSTQRFSGTRFGLTEMDAISIRSDMEMSEDEAVIVVDDHSEEDAPSDIESEEMDTASSQNVSPVLPSDDLWDKPSNIQITIQPPTSEDAFEEEQAAPHDMDTRSDDSVQPFEIEKQVPWPTFEEQSVEPKQHRSGKGSDLFQLVDGKNGGVTMPSAGKGEPALARAELPVPMTLRGESLEVDIEDCSVAEETDDERMEDDPFLPGIDARCHDEEILAALEATSGPLSEFEFDLLDVAGATDCFQPLPRTAMSVESDLDDEDECVPAVASRTTMQPTDPFEETLREITPEPMTTLTTCPDAPFEMSPESAVITIDRMHRSASVSPASIESGNLQEIGPILSNLSMSSNEEPKSSKKRTHDEMEMETADAFTETHDTCSPLQPHELLLAPANTITRPTKRARISRMVRHAAFAGLWMGTGVCIGVASTIYGLAAYADDD